MTETNLWRSERPDGGEFRFTEFETAYGVGFRCVECGHESKGNASLTLLAVDLDEHGESCPGSKGAA